MVHAHSPESIKASVNAGCHQIEHGVFATDEVLKLMADKGVYFDPERRRRAPELPARTRRQYLGIGNYNEEGFAFMEKGLALNEAMIKKAVATPKLKMVIGTDAVAGAHGHNARRDRRARAPGRAEADGRHRLRDVARRASRCGSRRRSARWRPATRPTSSRSTAIRPADINAVKRVAFVMRAGKVYKNIRN